MINKETLTSRNFSKILPGIRESRKTRPRIRELPKKFRESGVHTPPSPTPQVYTSPSLTLATRPRCARDLLKLMSICTGSREISRYRLKGSLDSKEENNMLESFSSLHLISDCPAYIQCYSPFTLIHLQISEDKFTYQQHSIYWHKGRSQQDEGCEPTTCHPYFSAFLFYGNPAPSILAKYHTFPSISLGFTYAYLDLYPRGLNTGAYILRVYIQRKISVCTIEF